MPKNGKWRKGYTDRHTHHTLTDSGGEEREKPSGHRRLQVTDSALYTSHGPKTPKTKKRLASIEKKTQIYPLIQTYTRTLICSSINLVAHTISVY